MKKDDKIKHFEFNMAVAALTKKRLELITSSLDTEIEDYKKTIEELRNGKQ